VRGRLAKLVFGGDSQSRAKLNDLERITHPRIGQMICDQLDLFNKSGTIAVVLDAAVMFEAGWDRVCDRIVFVDAAESVRANRAQLRGWTEQEFRQREAHQRPLEEKRKKATEVIDNRTDNRDDLRLQVRNIWRKWRLPIDLEVARNQDLKS
jgi:dephospho-CoA kinase